MGAMCSASAEEPVPDMTCPSCGAPVFKNERAVKIMQPMMRKMMNKAMKVGTGASDVTYKDVSDFMVPKMFNPNDAENWAKFNEQRPYCVPGYISKAPKPGDVVPDGKLISIDPSGGETTLLAEVKKLAADKGSSKVVISFDSVTCPFWRSYASEDLYKVAKAKKVPTLHVYIREAHPKDEFNAGPNSMGPIKLDRVWNKHTTEADRRADAIDARKFVNKHEPGAVMFMDGMDDALEAAYEARPWRQYVVEIVGDEVKMVDAIGLTPFNMAGKLEVIKKAVA